MRQLIIRLDYILNYNNNMSILGLIMIIFMAGAFAVVIIGVVAMAINGKLNKNHSNKLMRLRVLFQAVAVIVFVIIVLLYRN